MKKEVNIGLLLMSLLVLFLGGCSSNDDDQPQDSVDVQEVVNAVESGTWIITYFYDTDKEETSNFNSYSFVFNSDGSLVATNGSDAFQGTWSVTNSGSNDDSSNDIDFNISFLTSANFEDLSDDWDILRYSSNKIELVDVSGGNGGTDYLTFQKI